MDLKKIMVVDDDTDQIYTVSRILNESSDEYRVIGAKSSMACLELLEKNVIPDLILLDIMMPEMSGWELVKRLKKSPWNNIPVIFLTAHTNKIAKTVGGWLGDDYIEKPFDGANLKKRIDKVLKNTSRGYF